MAVIKCKMCGGDLVIEPDSTVAECEYCGSRQTVPAADNEKKLNLLASANKLRTACEFDRAAGVYDAIKAEFPSEAEAYWGLVLCKYGIEYVDDPATGKKIPTCHRLSYDSVMDDANMDLAMDCADAVARKLYREEAKQLEKIRTGILEISSKEKPYDIFICYKETDSSGDRTLDSVLAQDIYSALVDKGYRVFFSRITLQNHLGEAYEPYIFAALNSARVMLAIGTDPEYYSAVWVKNEWSRYLKICAADKSKHLIPCYKDMDAYDMPKEFRSLQGVDLGKMGAVQDILFNMEKYISLKKQNTTVIQEKVVVGNVGGSNKIASLLDRGNMALVDGEWAKADNFFEDVLNNDSRNVQAYIGKALAREKCSTMDAFVRKRKETNMSIPSETLVLQPDLAHIGEMVQKYSLPGYVEEATIRDLYDFDLSYSSEVSGWEKRYKDEVEYWAVHRQFARAEQFADVDESCQLLEYRMLVYTYIEERKKAAEQADADNCAKLRKAYAEHIAEADKKAEKIYNDGLCRREADYRSWQEKAKTETSPYVLRDLEKHFSALGDYEDSKNLAEHCRKRAAEEQVRVDAENERQKAIAEQKKKAQQKIIKTLAILAAAAVIVVIIAAVVVTQVIIPRNQYKAAEALLASGDSYGAAIAFAKQGDYRDARERSFELWNRLAVRDTIGAGFENVVGIESDGTVRMAGSNEFDEDVSGWTDIVAVAAEISHAVGLKADGTVIATGFMTNGEGDVDGWRDIVSVAVGNNHTVGLKADGTVVAVGSNENGQCNVSDWEDIIAVSSGCDNTYGLKVDGTVVTTSSSIDLSDWTDIVAIATDSWYTMGLKSDGTVVAAGSNYSSQRDVSAWTDIVAVATGSWHMVGLRADGTVVAAGDNDHGQCNVSNWTDIVAVAAGTYRTFGLKADGTVVITEFIGNRHKAYDSQGSVSSWSGIKVPPISPERQAAMDTGKQAREEQLAAEYAAAEELSRSGNTAKAALAFCALGDYQDARERSTECWDATTIRDTVSAGRFHTVGLKSDGTVLAIGYNQYGQCDVESWKNIIAVSAGGCYTVGVQSDGTVVAAGANEEGQCNVADWENIVSIGAGEYHTVALRSDGTVVATGWNKYGQCNVEDWTDIVAVSAGQSHTVGLKADGTVVATGWNEQGQCEVGDWTEIVVISSGCYHTVGIKANGTVVVAGKNTDSWFNVGFKSSKGGFVAATNTDNTWRNVGGWSDIIAVSAGIAQTVGIKSDGTVVAVGDNLYGRCDVSDWTDIVAVSTRNGHTVGLKSDGTVVTTGGNEDGQCDVSGWTNIKVPI